MRKGWFLHVALVVRLRLGLAVLLAVTGLIASCKSPRTDSEAMAIQELRTLEATGARNPTYGEFEVALKHTEPRIQDRIAKVEPLLRLEFERALAWYNLANYLWERNETANGKGVRECLAEAKQQTDWLQRYVASPEPVKKALMAQKETERQRETNAGKGVVEGFRSSLNRGGQPEEFFSRLKKSTPAPAPAPRPRSALPAPAAPAGPAFVVLTAQVEAKLPFGKVKLQPGTRLEVLEDDGTTITAKYGADRIAVPVGVTRAVR